MIVVRQIKYKICKKCRYVLMITDTTITTKQPDQSDEQIQPANNDTTIDIAYKTQMLNESHVNNSHVCYKHQIIKIKSILII